MIDRNPALSHDQRPPSLPFLSISDHLAVGADRGIAHELALRSAAAVVNGDTTKLYYNIFGLVEYLYLDSPVSHGHTWNYVGNTATWLDAGTVTVPAGTFTNCWRWQTNTPESGYGIYCRGVGLVRRFYPGYYDAVLTSKNF